MDEIPVAADPEQPEVRVEVDECAACGGVFLEFFDGEPIAIARGLSPAPPASRPAPVGEPLRCPDCDEAMAVRPYLGEGPELPRCETCLAIFLDRGLRAEMARARLSPEPPVEEPGWLDRLLSLLR